MSIITKTIKFITTLLLIFVLSFADFAIVGFNMYVYAEDAIEEMANVADESMNLTSTLLTNSIMKINEDNKRVVQVLVESGTATNSFQITDTNINLTVPQDAIDVEVCARQTYATNGKDGNSFTQDNWKYNKEESNVEINVSDEEENSSDKNGTDIFVVTYILPEDFDVSNLELQINGTITLNDDQSTQKQAETTQAINEEKDGTTATKVNSDETIYKGKLYSKEQRNYNVTQTIYAQSTKLNKNIDVTFEESTYNTDNATMSANIQYVESTINKEQVMNVLGENGILKISTIDGTEIATISNATETDENGNIKITYNEGIKQIKIETSEIENLGVLEIKSTKAIKPETFNASTIQSLKSINETITGSTIAIALNETETKAKISMQDASLSTLQTNENSEFTVTLLTDNEKYTLYKNPTISIELPSGVQSVNIKDVKLLYADGFSVSGADVYETNGKKAIKIQLTGEQYTYTQDINQLTINVIADIAFDILTPSSTQSIVMNYTNENAETQTFSESLDVNLESKQGLMIYNQMSNFNSAGDTLYTIDDDVQVGDLDVMSNEKTANVNMAVINNYDVDIQDVYLIGRIPTNGVYDGSVDATLTGAINTNIADAKIYYSQDANASNEDSSWTESAENARAFKLQFENVAKEQVIQISYQMAIPANISYGQSLYEELDTAYTFLGSNLTQLSVVGAKTENLQNEGLIHSDLQSAITSNMENGIQTEIATISGGAELKDGDSVYEGQNIRYEMKITNNTGKDLQNVKIKATQENAKIYDLTEVVTTNVPYYESDEEHIEHIYEELDTNVKEFDNIETLASGASIELSYEVVVNEIEDEGTTYGTIAISADDLEEKTVNTISNDITQAEIKANLTNVDSEELTLYAPGMMQSWLKINNIKGKDVSNLEVSISLPNNTSFDLESGTNLYANEEYTDDEGNECVGIDNRVTNIKYDETKNVITFEITKLDADEEMIVIWNVDLLDQVQETNNLNYLASIKVNDKSYTSNELHTTVYNTKKDVVMTHTVSKQQDIELDDSVEFTIEVTNNSNQQLMCTVQDDIPDAFEINNIVATYRNADKTIDATENIISYGNVLEEGETFKIVVQATMIKALSEDTTVENTVQLLYGEEQEVNDTAYYKWSHEEEDKLNLSLKKVKSEKDGDNIIITQTSNVENESVLTDGQEITYSIEIKNDLEYGYGVYIYDYFPSGLTIKNATFNGEDASKYVINDSYINIDNYLLASSQTATLNVTAEFDREQTAQKQLKTKVSVYDGEETNESNEILYYTSQLGKDTITDDSTGNSDGVDSGASSENENGNETDTGTYTISGVAWLDENKDGKRDDGEALLQGINMKILDTTTGEYLQSDGNNVEATTDTEGKYSVTVPSGSYVAVFKYDSDKYVLTDYQKSGVAENVNSDVATNKLNLDGVETTVGATNTITINGQNAENIDIGLTLRSTFDLELTKGVSKVTVQNSKETKTYNFNNGNLAKVEIAAKYLSNSTVIIEYNLTITNTGETAGYITNIADYIPDGLKFNSELNEQWYEKDGTLYNNSLQNTKIESGETKTVNLVLTKTMTESNTGLVSNAAEINEAYSTLGIDDIDSTPGNQAQDEDDYGTADTLISVKTGTLILYIGLTIAVLAIIGFAAYIINKKFLKKEKDEEEKLEIK